MAPSQTICPTCSCTEIDIVDVSGEAVCVSCGTIIEENNIVSSIEFHESGGGAHSVVGQFVSASSSKSYGNIGTSGRNYGMESRANTLANGKKKIRQIAGMLRLGDHYVDSAFRLFALALQRNFTHGRKAQTVIAACLYIVCRRERSPHLLIDFSDKLQINVYVLGGVFLKFCKLLQIHLPLIDPSLYIHRFASQLNFGAKTHSIATTALRLVATMKRDWIETGRRPSGICGAALLIAARSQSVMCSLHDVMDIVNIGERTLKQRLYEFSLTPTAQLTYDQVGRLEMSRVECDPPSFQRHREKEVMEMLLLESERLETPTNQKPTNPTTQKPTNKNGKARKKRTRRDLDEEGDEEDGDHEEDGNAATRKLKALKDEEMSRFLSWDAFYKKRPSGLLSAGASSTTGATGSSSSTSATIGTRTRNKKASAKSSGGRGEKEEDEDAEEDEDEEAEEEDDDDDDDEIDYGFENANDQIVNRASRLAAQEVLTRVRRKSARYIMRKREEADFYKTIERDLTLALEDESATANGSKAGEKQEKKETKTDKEENDGEEDEEEEEEEDDEDHSSASRRALLRRRGGSRRGDGDEDEDYDDEEEIEGEPDEGEEEEVEEEDEDAGASRHRHGRHPPPRPSAAAARSHEIPKTTKSEGGDGKRDDEDDENTFSDLDDDEINSLLLTKEEANKKKILWEKMNADYIKEQEEKRVNGLNHPEMPKKKRKKKVPDVNAPPPDTAQHAIYKLKSRRINYEVIDELFGEAANNGF